MNTKRPYRFFSPTDPADGLGGPPEIFVCVSDSEDEDEKNDDPPTPETLFKKRVKRESRVYQRDMEERARRASPTFQHEMACRTPNPDTNEFFVRHSAPNDAPEGQDLGSSSQSPAPKPLSFFKRIFGTNVKEPSLQALEERHREVMSVSPDNLVRNEQAKKLPYEKIKEDEKKREQREKDMQERFKKREKEKARRAKISPDEFDKEDRENEENRAAEGTERTDRIARLESAEIITRDSASVEVRDESLRHGMDEHEDGWYDQINVDELARTVSPTSPPSTRTRRTLRSCSSFNGLRSLASIDNFQFRTENPFRRGGRERRLNHTSSIGNLRELFRGGNRSEVAPSSSVGNLHTASRGAGNTTSLHTSANIGRLREVFQRGAQQDRVSHSTSVVDLTQRPE